MPDPDRDVNGLYASLPAAIFIFILTLTMFQMISSSPSFKLYLWIGIPILAYLVASSMNIATQYSACGSIDTGKAFLGGLTSLLSAFIGLFISSFEICRIPIASVFAPIFVGKTVDVTRNESNTTVNAARNSKGCCSPKLMLEEVETAVPLIKGIGYGFYMLFAMLFGGMVGTGIAVVC